MKIFNKIIYFNLKMKEYEINLLKEAINLMEMEVILLNNLVDNNKIIFLTFI